MEAYTKGLVRTGNPNGVDIHLNVDPRITQQCNTLNTAEVSHLRGK